MAPDEEFDGGRKRPSGRLGQRGDSARRALAGFAIRSADAPGVLAVLGESRAGHPFAGEVTPGGAVAISTGAVVPEGADGVVPVEEVRDRGDRVHVPAAVEPGSFVRAAGGDLRAGDVVMPAGSLVRARHLFALAVAGTESIPCRRRARAAVLTTGDEVRPHSARLGPGQVLDAAGPGVSAQARAAGADVVERTHVGDDPVRTRLAVERALGSQVRADLLLTVGGAPVGGHDHVPVAL